MVSLAHGAAFPDELSEQFASSPNSPRHLDFGYLFPTLQDPAHRVVDTPDTATVLQELGNTMVKTNDDEYDDSGIPSAYTYLGQFIAHDITHLNLRVRPYPDHASCDFRGGDLTTLGDENNIENKRGAQLQLDSIYNKAGRMPDKTHLQLGKVFRLGRPQVRPIFYNDWAHDVPRQDRSPLIADPRNDNNVIVSQLHVAFLRAHNTLVDFILDQEQINQEEVFERARTLLRQHFHWIIIYDYLKLIADEQIVSDVVEQKIEPLAMPRDAVAQRLPLEFTAAALKFGHSMIRPTYYYNDNLPSTSVSDLIPLLLMVDKSSGRATPTLPDAHVIQWERFVYRRKAVVATDPKIDNPNFAHSIVPALTRQMFNQLDATGQPLPCETNLAVMDLLRGFMLKLPTGQAVADYLNSMGRNIRKLMPSEIEAVAEKRSKAQVEILKRPTWELSARTPLWFYVLAEAEIINDGKKLGPVGSTIVAEVLVALVRRSNASILSSSSLFKPLPTASGKFQLADLLRLGRVLS